MDFWVEKTSISEELSSLTHVIRVNYLPFVGIVNFDEPDDYNL